MNKISVLFLGLLLLSSCATQAPILENKDATPLSYEFTWKKCGDKPCLHESLSFEMVGTQDFLKIPKEVIGMNDLYKGVLNLKITSPSGSISATQDPGEYLLKGSRGKKITVECDLVQDFEGDPSVNERYYRALINEQRFHLFGESLFIYPAWDKDKIRSVSLKFNLPSDFEFADSFSARETEQQVQTSIHLMREGTFFGGKTVRVKHFEIKGKPVWIAMEGKFGYRDEEFQNVLNRVLKTERDFWNDHDFPYYFVSAISVTPEGGSGGQGRLHGFAIMDGEKPLKGWLEHLLAHELFHTWNGHIILKQDREERIYWFSEGFTDYYANVLAYRAGLISFKAAIEEINHVIKRYYFSNARNATLDRVEAEFWKNQEVGRLPYQQGFLLAQAWNDEIKRKSKGKQSLDDLMLAMLHEAKTHHTVSSIESVEAVVETFLKRSVSDDINRWIVTGGTIPVLPEVLAKCARATETEVQKFNLGFDREASKANKVFTKVDPLGPAYAAGLREGDTVRGISLFYGDTNRPVELELRRNGEVLHLKYMPLGDQVRIPQYVVKRGCSPKGL